MPALCSSATVERNAFCTSSGGVALLGRKEAQRVVAPVVPEAVLEQVALVEEGMDRQQLDRGDAELVQMLDHGRRGEPAKGAAQLGRHVLALLGQAFDVRLVDDGVFPRHVRMAVVAPGVRLGRPPPT